MWNYTLAQPFHFSKEPRCPRQWLSRRPTSDCPDLRSSIAMGSTSSPRLYTNAKKLEIRSHIGAEISVDGFGDHLPPPSWQPHLVPKRPVRLTLLCESQRGYQNLSLLISHYKFAQKTKGDGVAPIRKSQEHSQGLVCLIGGDEGPLAAALARGGMDEGRQTLSRLLQTFGVKMSMSNCSGTACRTGGPQPGGHCACEGVSPPAPSEQWSEHSHGV